MTAQLPGPSRIGAIIDVYDSAALAALDTTGLTRGTVVFVTQLSADFTLTLSNAALVDDRVVAVLGITGYRWIIGGGSGTLTNVLSGDKSVIVTSPSSATRDLSSNGVYQLIDSYGVVNDAPALQAALTALAARPHNGGIVEGPAGQHRIGSNVAVPAGCGVRFPGKGCAELLIDGNAFDAFTFTDSGAGCLRGARMTAVSPRTSGRAVHVVGGNPAIQPFFPDGGYLLSYNGIEIEVDMQDQFDGVIVENNLPTSAAFLVHILPGFYNGMNGGDGIRINCPGTALGTDYGASFTVDKVFIYGASKTGNALRISGAGDFTVNDFQCSNVGVGCLIDPPANGRLSTGRFKNCQFDTSGTFCLSVLPAETAIFGDIEFAGCWFAGGATHNILINQAGGSSSSSVKGMRFLGGFNFDAGQYGAVLTGSATGASRIRFIGMEFSGAGTGGFRAVNARNFSVLGCEFGPSLFPPNMTMPQAATVDLGCQDFIIANNDWHLATAGLLDNSGAVNKIVTPNLG